MPLRNTPADPLLRELVDALVLAEAGQGEAELLVQLDVDAAAVVLRASQRLVILLAHGGPAPADAAIDARLDRLLSSEGADTLPAVSAKEVAVVLVGAGDAGTWLAAPPRVHPGLGRPLRGYLVDAGGVLAGPPGQVLDTLRTAVAKARKRLKGAPPADLRERLAAAETEGEETLKAEVRQARRFDASNRAMTLALVGLQALLFALEVLWGGATSRSP